MGQISQILEGYSAYVKKRLGKLPVEIQQEANSRYKICLDCPLLKKGMCATDVSGKHVDTGIQTYGCGCVVAVKVLSMNSECPLGKWKKYESNTEKSNKQ